MQYRGLTELSVWVAQDRELGEGGIIAGIGGAVFERTAMYASEKSIGRMDPRGGQVQGNRTEMSGLSDALQSFKTGPRHQVCKGMLLPAVSDFPETRVRLADAARAQLRQMAQELSLIHISEPTRLLSISY